MLETLHRYIEDDSGADGAAKSTRSIRLPLDRRLDNRFFTILGLSIACHFMFYLSLILLDSWVGHRAAPRHRRDREELVKIADIAPRSDKSPPLRPPPERLERVDLNNLVENPNLGDDTNLVSRSPQPGSGSDDSRDKGRSGREPGQWPGPRSSGSPPQQAGPGQNHTVQPPGARPIEMKQAPAPTEQAAVVLPGAQPAPAPPPPLQSQSARPPSRLAADAGRRDGSDESSGRPRELGLSVVESQYRAYVRRRIYDANKRTMPVEWIKTALSQEVSAEFLVSLDRNGRLISVKLIRSCGYANLDTVAHNAIIMASPFEGYPRTLGDTFQVAVTIHYTPLYD